MERRGSLMTPMTSTHFTLIPIQGPASRRIATKLANRRILEEIPSHTNILVTEEKAKEKVKAKPKEKAKAKEKYPRARTTEKRTIHPNMGIDKVLALLMIGGVTRTTHKIPHIEAIVNRMHHPPVRHLTLALHLGVIFATDLATRPGSVGNDRKSHALVRIKT